MTTRIGQALIKTLAASVILLASSVVHSEGSGSLVIIGGGSTPDDLLGRMVELAGGKDAEIVVMPQASGAADRGNGSADFFRRVGAENVHVLEFEDRDAAVARIHRANLIWFPGGQQSRLVESLAQARLIELLRQRYAAGAVIAGTSAGAAAMSEVMIPTSPGKQALAKGNTPIIGGLGLTSELMIDQHFVERSRMNRLLSAVIDHPDRIGVGIGEGTGIVLSGNRFRVWGDGSVVVIDARKAKVESVRSGQPQSSRGIRLDVLKRGDSFQFSDDAAVDSDAR